LLAKIKATFDPDLTLLQQDLTPSKEAGGTVVIHSCLKCPKESRSAPATTVDVYGNGGPLCPAKALFAWISCGGARDPGMHTTIT
jgi:hypothetical protein